MATSDRAPPRPVRRAGRPPDSRQDAGATERGARAPSNALPARR